MIEPALRALLGVVDEVFPIERLDVEAAKGLMLAPERLSARDAVHASVMRRRHVVQILSFDQGFDHLPGIERLEA